MHRVSKLAAGLTVLFGLAGTALMSPAHAQTSTLPNDILVRFGGAGTLGGKMMREVATAWAAKLGLTNVRVNAGDAPDEYEVVGDRAESMQKMRVVVSAKGTTNGIEPLMRGQLDFWMTTRAVQESDIDLLRKKNVPNVPTLQQFMTGGNQNLVGLAPLAILANHKNPVKSLTFQQIRDMYAGKITNWSQVGGPSLPVALFTLDSIIGTTDGFCGQVLGIKGVTKCLDSMAHLAAPRIQSVVEMADSVARSPGGLGYVALSERKNARAVPIGTECGTNIEPEAFLVKTDEYPLVTRLYLYSNPSHPLSPSARSFLDFILSSQGQAAVAKSGKADLEPSLAPDSYSDDRLDHVRDAQDRNRTRIRPTDARAFSEAVENAKRLSITFRFQAGTNDLDVRGDGDVTRLIGLMQQPAFKDKEIVLIGASGDYSEGRALSRDRASAVRERLMAESKIKDVVSIGVGPAAAIACNLDPNTAPLNQRVEVWLRKRT
jgi:phosphate transport system substrate-binding protein